MIDSAKCQVVCPFSSISNLPAFGVEPLPPLDVGAIANVCACELTVERSDLFAA